MKKNILLFLLLLTPIIKAQWIVQHTNTDEGTASIDFIDKDNGWVVAGNKKYLLHTTDGGNSWIQIQTFDSVRKVKFFDKNTGIILREPDQFYKTTDGGQTWNLMHTYYWARNLFFLNKDIGWVIYDWSLFKTTDGGSSWKTLISHDVLAGAITSFFAVNADTAWMVQGGYLCKSIDGGMNWTKGNESVNEIYFYNSKIGWKIIGNNLFKTMDGGITWKIIYQAANEWSRIQKIRFLNSETGYCIKLSGTRPRIVCKTIDSGKTWKELSYYDSRTDFELYDYDFVDENNLWFIGFFGTIAKYNTEKIIDLKSPIGNETFFIDRDYKINWIAYNLENEKCRIELSRDKGNSWETIKDSVNLNDSSTTWHVKKYSSTSTNCKVKITHLNSNTSDISDSLFSIYANGHLSVKYPVGNELFYGNTQITVKWDADYESRTNIVIQYLASVDTIQNNFKPFYTYRTTVSTRQLQTWLPYGNIFCKVKIYDENEPYIFAESNIFKIKDKPQLALNNSLKNWIFPADSIRPLQIKSTNVGSIKGEISFDGGISWTNQFKIIHADSVGTSDLKVDWKVPNRPSKKCKLRIYDASDIYNNTGAESDTFEITSKSIVGEFPLKIGNRWYYKSSGYNNIGSSYNYDSFTIAMVAQITGEILLGDGNKYFQMDQYSWPPDSSNSVKLQSSIFLRQNQNKVYQYLEENNSPQLFDFETGAYISNILGKSIRMFGTNINYSTWLFADSIGFSILNASSNQYYGSQNYLVGCILDDIPYGEILPFKNYTENKLVYPLNESKFNNDNIVFRWTRNNNANKYRFILEEKRGDPINQRVIYEEKVNLLLSDTLFITSLEKKEYRWKVLTYYGNFFISSNVFYFNNTNTVSVENEIPSEYALSQNYPNPFNPSTTINYSIATAGNVTLKVYDLLGREVAALVDEYKQAGTYNYTFNIMNYSLPSGVYFYRLHAGSFTETKKFVLMK